MMRPSTPTKELMIEAARALIRRRGVAATSMLDVLAESGSPRGSLYHHFPGGKTQMIEEATLAAIAEYTAGFDYLAQLDPREAIPLIVDVWRNVARDSRFSAGCPVVAAALAGEQIPSARELAGEAFARWIEMLEQMLRNASIPEESAHALATLILASVEGSVIMGLAQRSTEPMDRVADELVAMIERLPTNF